ncbi:hypothetical protein OCU04_002671 [Sclerotinia nivalis]|uniref:Uncharacterized protein n=1 Tax=Sclerotinia nivalis TaxID=352851 RepID=A0A9X0AU46_9HELO|nr:hypothetical protein OCU04_002671 [Sclerotinia nivalis]
MNPPDDLETTSLALHLVPPKDAIVHSILDDMLDYVNSDGIPYRTHHLPRVPARIPDAESAGLDVGYSLHRAYLSGTYYYRTAEWFLSWLHRFVKYAGHYPSIQEEFKTLLKQRIQERIGAPGDALAPAMRLTICHDMDVPSYQDMETLKELQCEDEGMLIITIVGKEVYDRGLTTALAVQAIREKRSLDNGQIVDGEVERL